MRFLSGLMLLLPLASPFAQAELIDEVNDRGELLAKELEVNPSIIVTQGSDLLSGVESGKYDVAINHVAMTPDLQNRFDFSEPYGYTRTPLQTGPVVTLAIPFQKSNPAFQTSLDNALQRTRVDGRLAALSQKWLGMDATKP